MRPLTLIAGFLSVLALTACSDDDDDDDDGGSMPTDTTTTMEMDYTGLEPLGDDYVYEGWLADSAGMVTSSGRFIIDDSGSAVPSSFEIDDTVADEALTFILTIEPAVGDDPAPAATHILAGGFSGGMADLDTAHGAALGTDFASAMGTYFLATPTSADTMDEDQGIWFIDASSGSPTAGLDVPTLPSGWVYEGWVVVDGSPISTGRFTDPAAADDDGAGPAAGAESAPPFPGQDFITPPTVLDSATVVLSVEPEPDNSAAPFSIKPLVGTASGSVGHDQQSLNQNLSTVPSGTITFDSATATVSEPPAVSG